VVIPKGFLPTPGQRICHRNIRAAYLALSDIIVCRGVDARKEEIGRIRIQEPAGGCGGNRRMIVGFNRPIKARNKR